MSECLLVLSLLAGFGAVPQQLVADDGQPRRYRDLQIYAESEPGSDATVTVRVTLRNTGARPLQLSAEIPPAEPVGLAEAVSLPPITLEAGLEHDWQFEIEPPTGLQREVVQGRIWIGELHARDLYLAFAGPDPRGLANRDVQPLTAPATVVASYAPRTAAAVDAARRRNTPRTERPILFASPHADAVSWVLDDPIADADTQRRAGLDTAIDDLGRVLRKQVGAGDRGTLPLQLRLLDKPLQQTPHDEAFRLRIAADGVRIQSVSPYGLTHGLYTLMTDYMDCHWFMPGPLGEEIVVPADRSVRLPAVDRLYQPSFVSVNGMSWGAQPLWDRRNRTLIGQGRMTFGHAWHNYINGETYPYETHAQLYARDAEGNILKHDHGWTHTNFCTTEPQVLEIVAAAVNDQLAKDQVMVASLDPNDYAPMCLCERCIALDQSYGVEEPDGSFVTDRLLHFSQEIYDRLDEPNRKKYLGILIYGFQMQLPVGARPHPKHAGLICNQPWVYDHSRPFNDPTSSRNRDFRQLVEGWGELVTQLGFYDYYGHFAYFGPWGLVPKLREDLPAFHDMGGTYLMIEAQGNFAGQGLNHYVAAQLAWDVTRDVDLLVDDFYRLYYGPAEAPMREYWESIQRHQALTRSAANVHRRLAERPGIFNELEGYLRQAEVAADGAERRFRLRVRSARDGLKWARLRWTIEGPTPISLHRPATVEMLAPEHDLSIALAYLESHRSEFTELWDKYTSSGSAADWPPLTPEHFQPQIEEVLQRIRDHERRRLTPRDRRPRRGEP